MDLMYLPDSIAYQTRLYDYTREDQTWVNVNQTSEKPKRERSQCGKEQKSCSICKSRQKRVLSNYIMKTRRDSDKDTFIEEEEEENEDCQEKLPNNRANNPTSVCPRLGRAISQP